MMRRNPRSDVKATVKQAIACARLAGSETVEAEHFLLALAGKPGTIAYAVLSEAGLDAQRISDALAVEQAASLAAVGVTALTSPLPTYLPEARQMGQSSRLALTRAAAAAKARKDRRMRSTHLLIGVLSADVGRVPRALAHAGVDRGRMLAECHAALDHYQRTAS
jgi:ATP-dependent Clp protease ATP-binding subunit ClpA